MVINPVARIYVQSIVTDNSNPSYPDCIKLVYWKLMCEDGMFRDEQSLSTRFDLDPNNFILFSDTDVNTLETWIKNSMGSKFNDLVEEMSNSIIEENAPPEPSDTIRYFTYNSSGGTWQLQ